MRKIFTLFFVLLFIPFLPAQTLKHCGTTEAILNLIQNNPDLKEKLIQRQKDHDRQEMEKSPSSANSRTSNFVYIIPIVFHIVHNYGPEDISDAQVIDAVRILNQDYRKLNADTTDIVPEFKGLCADIEIEFRLANLDPNGNCTNGIDRIVSNETYLGTDGSKLNAWPSNMYLNVWTVQNISSGAAGYAYYPGYAPAGADGVIILADYVGSIGTGNYFTARALTHEIGHWLNLSHVWGDTNSPGVACGNDGISDTPFTKGWTSCNLSNNDICNAGVVENVQNYMEYSYCSRMFTIDQKTAMRNALQSSLGGRNNIWISSNQTDTGVDYSPANICSPNSDFKSNFRMVCAGTTVTYTDLSWNAQSVAWQWAFPGGTPSTSTSSNPTVVYNTPGTYDVALNAYSSTGMGSATKSQYIFVSPTTAWINSPYNEGFEKAGAITSYNPDTWIVRSGDNVAWSRSTSAAFTGSGSMKLANFSAAPGDVDEAISNSYDLTTVSSPTFTFQLAYNQKLAANNDKLRVLVSTDCGKTWVARYTKSGTALKTATNTQTTNFNPTVSQWRMETVSIAAYAGNSNVRFKFEFTGDSGNNIFIDDINISGVTGIANPDIESTLNLSVYPNPLESNSIISFNLLERKNVKITLSDVLGRKISDISSEDFSEGRHDITLSSNKLNPGLYFVNLVIDNRSFTRKVFVKN